MADITTRDQTEVDACVVRQVDAERVTQGRALLLDDQVYDDTAAIFRALGDPSRAKIVYSLLQQELCVCDLAAVCELSESSTSQHLRVLRGLRVVRLRRDGRMSYYSIDDDHIRVLLGVCLNHLQHRQPLHGIAEPAGFGAK
jgi:ArsR family transcriptional regulator, lead/cadmium/zinc/bismuth-responsive transcriptional repressor